MSKKVTGNALVHDNALVHGNAQVYGDARVYGDAWVYDNARVYGDARVYGNARVYGDAWVYGNARVYGDARVHGNAWVYGNARVHDNADLTSPRHLLTVGLVGSENRIVTIHRHYDGPTSSAWGHLVIAGCWQGTLDQLADRIANEPEDWADGDDSDRATWRADYEAVIALARVRVAEWAAEPLTDADHQRWADKS